jgi:hypothetical protein
MRIFRVGRLKIAASAGLGSTALPMSGSTVSANLYG